MIFFDTCIWFELLSGRTPVEQHEIDQAQKASNLLNDVLMKKKEIVSCQEQIAELIKSIEKAAMKATNRERKSNGLSGFGKLKDYRNDTSYNAVVIVAEAADEGIRHLAKMCSLGEYDFQYILSRIKLADINDILYYKYCVDNAIDFYTFDGDILKLGANGYIHVL